MRKGTLGPFPKTRRWRDIVAATYSTGTEEQGTLLSDLLLSRAKARLETYAEDPMALRAVVFWAMLPISTRSEDPVRVWQGLEGPSLVEVRRALDELIPTEHPVKASVSATLDSLPPDTTLFESDPWDRWRTFDGLEFCNLAQRFYANLMFGLLQEIAPDADLEALETHSRESAVITRAFSARWFNACARRETPDQNSIGWYFRHCLGKLDLELSREMSSWVEVPRKRKESEDRFLEGL